MRRSIVPDGVVGASGNVHETCSAGPEGHIALEGDPSQCINNPDGFQAPAEADDVPSEFIHRPHIAISYQSYHALAFTLSSIWLIVIFSTIYHITVFHTALIWNLLSYYGRASSV